MQDQEVIEEIIVTLPLLRDDEWAVLVLLATGLLFGVLAWLQRQGKPWIGRMLVLTSIPAVSGFFAPFIEGQSAFDLLLTIDTTETLMFWLWGAGPLLSSIFLLLWKLRLLVLRPVARRTVWVFVGVLVLVIISDAFLVAFLHDDWLFPEPSPYLFGLSATMSVVLIVLVSLQRVSAAASISLLLMMIFIMHSTVLLSAILDRLDPDIGVGLYASLLALAVFAAEFGYTIVREWNRDAYWVWDAEQTQ